MIQICRSYCIYYIFIGAVFCALPGKTSLPKFLKSKFFGRRQRSNGSCHYIFGVNLKKRYIKKVEPASKEENEWCLAHFFIVSVIR